MTKTKWTIGIRPIYMYILGINRKKAEIFCVTGTRPNLMLASIRTETKLFLRPRTRTNLSRVCLISFRRGKYNKQTLDIKKKNNIYINNFYYFYYKITKRSFGYNTKWNTWCIILYISEGAKHYKLFFFCVCVTTLTFCQGHFCALMLIWGANTFT
jgi:hypothetical protein